MDEQPKSDPSTDGNAGKPAAVASMYATLAEKLGRVGFTQERKALALTVLGLFTGYFLLLVMIARTEMPEWYPAFAAMFALYFITFFGVAAHWFWGRWVAIGIGSWGATIAIWGIVTARAFEPALIFLGATHGLIALLLMGNSMGVHYEGRADWRVRFGLDDEGVKRLRRSVTRAASSVPAIVLFALAPRQEGGAALLLCVVLGIGTLLIGRTIAIAALGLAAAGAFSLAMFGSAAPLSAHGFFIVPAGELPQLLGIYAGVALLASIAPFLGPIGRFLRR